MMRGSMRRKVARSPGRKVARLPGRPVVESSYGRRVSARSSPIWPGRVKEGPAGHRRSEGGHRSEQDPTRPTGSDHTPGSRALDIHSNIHLIPHPRDHQREFDVAFDEIEPGEGPSRPGIGVGETDLLEMCEP